MLIAVQSLEGISPEELDPISPFTFWLLEFDARVSMSVINKAPCSIEQGVEWEPRRIEFHCLL